MMLTTLKRLRNRRLARISKSAIPGHLNTLADSPWALSCASFLVTALLLRSNALTF